MQESLWHQEPAFPLRSSSWLEYMCTEEKKALGQACEAAETVMHTVMQIPQSSEPHEEQEKKSLKPH